MKVILKKRVANLGEEWDIVTVKDGYARNFLLPKQLATPATASLTKIAAKKSEDRLKKMEEIITNAKEVAGKLKDVKLSFKKKARGEKLYGSIGVKDIAAALKKEEKLEVEEGNIKLKEAIKTTGEHKVEVELTEGAKAKISIIIEAE